MTSIDINTYSATDDAPHADGAGPDWQESVLFTWFDEKAELGGFYRLGHEPQHRMGNCCFGVFTTSGERFRWNVTGAPMVTADRAETHMGLGPTRATLADGLRLSAQFADCEAELTFRDYHARFDYLDLVGIKRDDFVAHHFEVAGHMTGRVVLAGRGFDIDAQGYRDRSWGNRHWNQFRSARWWPIVFGPDLSMQVVHFLSSDGKFRRYGYLMRNGVPELLRSSRIVLPVEDDAFTYRSAQLELESMSGERLLIDHQVRDGIILEVRGFAAMEGIGTARLDGRTGFANLEANSNPLGGSQAPALVLYANMRDGFSRCPPDHVPYSSGEH
jgi:hypothetical protein